MAFAVISAEGELFVLQLEDRNIVVIDETGDVVPTIGRQGEGPGEFEMPSAIWFQGDTLVASDRQLFRVSYFDTDGRFLERSGRANPLTGPCSTEWGRCSGSSPCRARRRSSPRGGRLWPPWRKMNWAGPRWCATGWGGEPVSYTELSRFIEKR